MKISTVPGLIRISLFALFMTLAPLVAPALAQNSNNSNNERSTTNVNRDAEPRRTEARQDRDVDFPWGLLGLAGLLGLLRRPKRIVETVEVHDTNVRTEPRRDADPMDRPGGRP